MAHTVTRRQSGDIELTITLPWTQVAAEIAKQTQAAVAAAKLPGFRPGKAPASLVEPQLDKNQLYSATVQALLPPAYAAAVKDRQLKPILYPHIHVSKIDPDQDWVFTLHTCEVPTVTLIDYQPLVAGVAKDPADTRIVRILDVLRQRAGLNLPDMLVEEEANHRLSALVENLTQLGMTTKSYLEAKKITSENLKAAMARDARADLEAEFILSHIQTEQKLPDRKHTLDYLLTLV